MSSPQPQPQPQPQPRYRKPSSGPSPAFVQDMTAWTALVDSSIERASAAAEKWRAGLAGFITVVTSILILKGPDAAQKLPYPWNLVVVGLLVTGAVFAVRGLWYALSASAPPNATQHFQAIIKEHGTIRAFGTHVANESHKQLAKAKRWVLAALIALIMGIVAWWIVPPPPAPSAQAVSLETVQAGPLTICGKLISARDGNIDIQPASEPDDPTKIVSIQMANVRSMKMVDSCDTAPRTTGP